MERNRVDVRDKVVFKCDQTERDERLLDRRQAAAYVGVTVGRFEELVRNDVIPPPGVVEGTRRWPISGLDLAKSELAARILARAPNNRPKSPPHREQRIQIRELPDAAWFEERPRLLQRIGKSSLSSNELSALREFKVRRQGQISMYGYYGSFEALMARGLVVEVSRAPPSSRPLVTYRLTCSGSRFVSSLRDELGRS